MSLDTSHGQFLLRSDPNTPPVTLLLRGVNLSSAAKLPSNDPNRGFRPLSEDEFDLHLSRLRSWGFNVIRLIVTWEALEPFPGQYDDTYIAYLVRLIQSCKEHSIRVFISAHQDVFSRFTGGSGAPVWALEAMGLAPQRIHDTCAALLHSEWDKHGWGGKEGQAEAAKDDFASYPDMLWNTNLHRLASRHCFTMFFASHIFAPKCVIDGQPISHWLQNKHIEAYGHFADRIPAELFDSCLIGWDTMNEPHEGFIGIPDLNEIPPSQEFRKGPSPTPLQSLLLGIGRSVESIAYDDFTSLGHKKLGQVTISPSSGVWQTRDEARAAESRYGWKWDEDWDFWQHQGCPYAGHDIWAPSSGTILKPGYFKSSSNGHTYDFMTEFWRPHYEAYIHRIRRAHPHAITFINPPVFGTPPDLSEDTKAGRVAMSPHFYDGLTMLGKRRHKFNANAVGLQRGDVGILGAIKIGTSNIRSGLRNQLQVLKSDARKRDGIAENISGKKAYPTLIGELGVPFDMKPTSLLGLARGKSRSDDYTEPTKAMDELLNACDGENALSYTIWNYEPRNNGIDGDGWNGEDLSIISEGRPRGIRAWCRPFPVETMGRLNRFTFDMASSTFELELDIVSLESSTLWQSKNPSAPLEEGCTVIYLPSIHYARTEDSREGKERLIGSDDVQLDLKILAMTAGRLEVDGHYGRWYYPIRDGSISLRICKWK